MDQNQKTDFQISYDEMRLIRLFRCMDEEEKHNILVAVAKTVMKSFSVVPNLENYSNLEEVIKLEMSSENVENYDEILLDAWPGNWENRKMVDLDHFGDPGAILEYVFPEGVCEHIMGSSIYDDQSAGYLAEEFIQADQNYWNSVMFTAWEDAMEENEDAYDSFKSELQDDFVNFIREWRERVLDTFEKQKYGVK